VPRTEQDFAIEASNNALIVFDNLSSVAPWLSDAICRLSTGGGFAARTLYTDIDQTILKFCRPSVINGITDLATKGDLLERSILVALASITTRKDEKEFRVAFEAARPRLLGALLDGVVSALANLPNLQMPNRPRMADFAKWATAAGPAFGWGSQEFLDAYTENIGKGTTLALEEVTFVPFLRQFAEQNTPWQGTATDLLNGINRLAMGNHDSIRVAGLRMLRNCPTS
jgi:putative DNA primase/helicase